MVRTSTTCHTSKIHRHTETGSRSFYHPQRRFEQIHIKEVGPLSLSEGCCYLFTVIIWTIQRDTRKQYLHMSDATFESVALLFGWITRFDISEHFTSDRGTSFTSQLWTSLRMLLGTSTQHTTVYNPEVNSMVERFHRTLKADLITR